MRRARRSALVLGGVAACAMAFRAWASDSNSEKLITDLMNSRRCRVDEAALGDRVCTYGYKGVAFSRHTGPRSRSSQPWSAWVEIVRVEPGPVSLSVGDQPSTCLEIVEDPETGRGDDIVAAYYNIREDIFYVVAQECGKQPPHDTRRRNSHKVKHAS
jgi:hypothetical protein